MSRGSCAAIVPINALGSAKTRLRPLLDAADRRRLVRWLGEHVLTTLLAVPEIATVALVSPDTEVLGWGRELGALPIYQRSGDLNVGLELARERVVATGADTVLVALGDLPLLTVPDVAALLEHLHAAATGDTLERHAAVVLAADRVGRGTNLLAVRPAAALPFSFGVNSLARHQRIARERGIEPVLYTTPGMRFDVDEPADVQQLAEGGLWRPTSADGEAAERKQAWSA